MQVVYLRSKHAEGQYVATCCPTYLVNDFGDLVQIAMPEMIQGYGDAALMQPVAREVFRFAARNEPGFYYA
jgi:hypothetical protein